MAEEFAQRLDAFHGHQVELAIAIDQPGGGEDVEVRMDLASGDTMVKADPFQLEQVLVNLFLNSIDAIEEAGEPAMQPRQETVVATWSPNHIGLRVATAALTSFRRDAQVFDAGESHGFGIVSCSRKGIG